MSEEEASGDQVFNPLEDPHLDEVMEELASAKDEIIQLLDNSIEDKKKINKLLKELLKAKKKEIKYQLIIIGLLLVCAGALYAIL